MKLIQFIIVLSFILNVPAIHGQISEIKGNKHTYIQEKTKSLYIVYNKCNTLMDAEGPIYLERSTHSLPTITIEPKTELDSIVFSHFTPFFKKYTGEFKRYTALFIYLYADTQGIIKEIQITYPTEVGAIPITAIEDFENAILRSNIRLKYDKNDRIFEGTTYVFQYTAYDPDDIRNGFISNE